MSTRICIAALALAFAACDDSSDPDVIDDPVGDAVDDGYALGEQLAADIAAEFALDQPTIIAQTGSMLRALNEGEINQALFAAPLLQEDDVFEYANVMIDQHQTANVRLDDVMRFYNVGYQPTQAEANLRAEAAAGIQALRAAPLEDIDFVYIDLQVRMHASAQVVLDQLASMVEPGPMDEYIANLRTLVDGHLEEAEDILDSFFF